MGLSRRAFLKFGGATLAGALVPRFRRGLPGEADPPWPTATSLGRVTESRIRLNSRPHPDGERLGVKYFDDVVAIQREVVGKGFFPHNHNWFETPEGFLYSSWTQPVRAELNPPLPVVPAEGIYVQVSVPFTDARAEPDPQATVVYRLYYASVYRVAERAQAVDGSVWYRIDDENGVRMFGEARHLRPVSLEEFAPLSPGVEEKSVRASLGRQMLSAFEGGVEVFRARMSSGRSYFGPDGTTVGSLTPAGPHPIWSKRASRHMTGGTPANGYDLPGVPWVSYFAGNGAAIHGTYWHNDFGTPKSAGCLNVRPEDAKWLFRWTLPEVPYVPGIITVEWPGGTRVIIDE